MNYDLIIARLRQAAEEIEMIPDDVIRNLNLESSEDHTLCKVLNYTDAYIDFFLCDRRHSEPFRIKLFNYKEDIMHIALMGSPEDCFITRRSCLLRDINQLHFIEANNIQKHLTHCLRNHVRSTCYNYWQKLKKENPTGKEFNKEKFENDQDRENPIIINPNSELKDFCKNSLRQLGEECLKLVSGNLALFTHKKTGAFFEIKGNISDKLTRCLSKLNEIALKNPAYEEYKMWFQDNGYSERLYLDLISHIRTLLEMEEV